MPGPAFIEGTDVTLRPVESEDLAFVQRNVNHPDVRETTELRWPKNMAQEEAFLQEVASSDGSVHLLITDDDPVGMVMLPRIDHEEGTAHVGVWIAPEHQERGYATEALELAVTYAFEELRIHRVMARVHETNAAVHRILERIGFTHEGQLREAAYVGGEYRDVDVYGVLADEWTA